MDRDVSEVDLVMSNSDSMSERESVPRVATVILNYNQYALTFDTLESLRESKWKNHVVILVDNHSSDGSVEKLRPNFPEVEIVEPSENLGCAGGRNFGAHLAIERGADYVFFLDNDMYIAEDCITRLVSYMERDSSIGVIGPKMMRHPEINHISSLGTRVDWQRCVYQSNQDEIITLPADGLIDSAWVPGGTSMVRASVFQDVGYMDERFFIYFEDTDFSFRIRQQGFRVAVAPDAVLWHREKSSVGVGSPSSAYYYTRNRLLFFASYSPRPVFSCWFLTSRALAWSARLVLGGEWRIVAGILAGLRDAVLGRWGKRH